MFKKYIMIFALINLVSYVSLEAMQLTNEEIGRSIYCYNRSPENTPELANRRTSSPSILDFMKQDNARNQNSPVQFTPDIEQELVQRLESIITECPQSTSTPLTFKEYLTFSLTPHTSKSSCYLLLQQMINLSKLDENKVQQESLATKKAYVVEPEDGTLYRIDTKAQALYAIDGKLYKGYQPKVKIIDYFRTNTGDLMLYTEKRHFIELETITSFEACDNSTILYTHNDVYSIEE